MKTLKFYALLGTLALAIVFVSCSKDETIAPFNSAQNGASTDLNNFEKAGLLSLVEKQKLHRDIYDLMAEKDHEPIFTIMSVCDAKYMELLSIKVDKYGLDNPTVDNMAGEYENAQIQADYNEFIRSNNFDLNQMLVYARKMEEAIIIEIRFHEANVSGNTDIVKIYDDLINESQIQLEALNDELKSLTNINVPDDDKLEI